MPTVRTIAHDAGLLVLICAAAAVAGVALSANALATRPLPGFAATFWIAIGLGTLQITCFFLIWRIFIVTRGRFAARLQAVTGGLDDRIFLADAEGIPLAILTSAGWTTGTSHEWLGAIHPEDQSLWEVGGVTSPQRLELRLKDGTGEWRWHRLRATPIKDSRGAVSEWVGALHDIHEQKLASENRDLVIGELRHRLKNLVTVIDALAKNSRQRADEPGVDGFLQRFLGRLHALGAAGDVVLAGTRGTIEASVLIRATLAPFMNENAQRFHLAGPALILSEELGGSLGLALHELATNALKYGALSVPEGSVSLTWTEMPAGDANEILVLWRESGGPPPSAPEKPGFGTRMIKSVVSREKSGRVDIDYRPEGLSCRISFVK